MKRVITMVAIMCLLTVSVLAVYDRDATRWSVRDKEDGMRLNAYATMQRGCQAQGHVYGRDEGVWTTMRWRTRDCADVTVDTATKTVIKTTGRVCQNRVCEEKPVTVTYYMNQDKVKVNGYTFTEVRRLR